MAPKSPIYTVIIDPVSPELVRGSQSYISYILFAAEQARDPLRVTLAENFGALDIDDLPDADRYWIGLWAQSQIEQVKSMIKFLPASSEVKVFGYRPLIEAYNLPLMVVSEETIMQGMKNLVHVNPNFIYDLGGDADMHLKAYSGHVYSFYTTYGCPNSCAFCPATVGQHHRIVLPLEDVKTCLSYMGEQCHLNIHIMDDDFFFDIDRAQAIVEYIRNSVYNKLAVIVLASRQSLARYVKKYGSGDLVDAGFKLIEVGLETADEELCRKMGKAGQATCETLAQACSVPILWLTLTFFPGETIKSLRATGEFLEKYGLNPDQLYKRLRTNSTVGGLGQFFQPYEGSKGFEDLHLHGELTTARPLRLIPSFIPTSFIRDEVKNWRMVKSEENFWYDLYCVPPPTMNLFYRIPSNEKKTVANLVRKWDLNDPIDGYISLAISARLGVIE